MTDALADAEAVRRRMWADRGVVAIVLLLAAGGFGLSHRRGARLVGTR